MALPKWIVASRTAGFTSLNAATGTGAGTAASVAGSAKYGLQVKLGGTVNATGCVVALEGTIDGTHWFALGTWSLAGGQSDGDIIFVVDKPVAQVRANCTTLSGGASPTVSAFIGAV